MIDKTVITIGDKIYHRGLSKHGIFDEICFALEAMNSDTTSVFILFDGEVEPKEVSCAACELCGFDPPNLCQKCFAKLNDNRNVLCDSCIKLIQDRICDEERQEYGGKHGFKRR